MAKSTRAFADLSVDPSLETWFREFAANSRMSPSDIVREALNYYRTSSRADLVLLKKQIDAIQGGVWRLEKAAEKAAARAD